MQPIILASSSPYRQAVLEKLNLPFTTESPEIDETPLAQESASELVKRLARRKAEAVAANHRRALVIGSDQVAVFNQQIIGKPLTHDNAIKQLQQFSGGRVSFYTGLSLLNGTNGHCQTIMEPFHVDFRTLSRSQIEHYLERDQPYQCAGSFKSEGFGITLFKRLQGDDPNTLIGLPLIRLIELLNNEGVEVI